MNRLESAQIHGQCYFLGYKCLGKRMGRSTMSNVLSAL